MWAWGSHGVDPLPPRWCRDPSSLGEHLSKLRIQACVHVPLLGLRGQEWQAEWSARGAVSWVPFPRHVHARARCWDTSGEMPLMSQGPLPISKYGAHSSFSPGSSVFRKTLRCCCFSRQEQQLECFSQKPHQCRHDFRFSYKCRKAYCSHLAQSYQVFEQGVCQNVLEDSVGKTHGVLDSHSGRRSVSAAGAVPVSPEWAWLRGRGPAVCAMVPWRLWGQHAGHGPRQW